jgi:hypothetical protein
MPVVTSNRAPAQDTPFLSHAATLPHPNTRFYVEAPEFRCLSKQ